MPTGRVDADRKVDEILIERPIPTERVDVGRKADANHGSMPTRRVDVVPTGRLMPAGRADELPTGRSMPTGRADGMPTNVVDADQQGR
jgi:hypothetical protein